MRELHLLRHAKSSWDDPSLTDFDRPLAPRGRRAAKKVGAHLRTAGVEPALVLCSPSRRTRETLDLIGPLGTETRFEPSLYGAGPDELCTVVRSLPDEMDSVLVIGHNPGLQELAIRLAGAGDERQIERMTAKMPTAALASFDLRIDAWGELAGRAGTLVGYVVPKEL